MTFLEWCRAQRKRSDAVGDFARDWVADPGRPRAPSEPALGAYLYTCNASEEAVFAGRAAHREWREVDGRWTLVATARLRRMEAALHECRSAAKTEIGSAKTDKAMGRIRFWCDLRDQIDAALVREVLKGARG